MRSQKFSKIGGLFKSVSSMAKTRHIFQNRPSHLIHLPWHISAPSSRLFATSVKNAPITGQFFHAMEEQKKTATISSVNNILCSKAALRSILKSVNSHAEGNYLQDYFIYWLSAYAAESRNFLQGYFLGQYGLTAVCKDFIHFCFKQGISLDEHKTLQSFGDHNQLLDTALKQELVRITPKENINILGFGLDEGHYEMSLGRFLISQGITKVVNIYGFDPYARKTPGIEYLMPDQLRSGNTPSFDLIVARWALHHVALQNRWDDFISCINRCTPGAMVLIVEHGFLKEQHTQLDKRLYYLFNATFDIVANIGLRPHYFTDTKPDLGANFFLRYLEPEDFNAIGNNVALRTTQNIFDIGPGFPNQTICCMRLSG